MIYCKWRNNDNIITDTYVKEDLQNKLLKLSVSRSNSRERLREKNKTSLDPIMWNKNTHHRLQNNLQLQTPFIKILGVFCIYWEIKFEDMMNYLMKEFFQREAGTAYRTVALDVSKNRFLLISKNRSHNRLKSIGW